MSSVFRGNICPATGWGKDFPFVNLSDALVKDMVKTDNQHTHGYALFRDWIQYSKLQLLESNVGNDDDYVYFRGLCDAAMKDNRYQVIICMKNGRDIKVTWAKCSCPAGTDGDCKHVAAVLFFIVHLSKLGEKKIPDGNTCTGQIQMWHYRKPTSDDPLLFSELDFVKYDPEKSEKRPIGCNVSDHNPVPGFAKRVTQKEIYNLCAGMYRNGISLPVVDTLVSNKFLPVSPKDINSFYLVEQMMGALETGNTACDLFGPSALSDSQDVLYQTFVKVSVLQATEIEKQTKLQSSNKMWKKERLLRITASTFGKLSKLRDKTEESIIRAFGETKRDFRPTKAMSHGLQNEDRAVSAYHGAYPDREINTVGLVVNPLFPFMGASPDRVAKKDEAIILLEVKCPFSIYDRSETILENIGKGQFFLKKNSSGMIYLKENHDYYYQIQGQLGVCNLKACDLVVYVPPDDLCVVSVPFNQQFFQEMVNGLSDIYFKFIFPHLESTLSSTGGL